MEDRPLWEPKTAGSNLRLPKLNNSFVQEKPTDDKDQNQQISVVPPEKSTLNALASEFVPKNVYYTPIQKTFSVQDRLRAHRESDRKVTGPTQDAHSSNSRSSEPEEDSVDIRRLKQLITTLTNDPGEFDNLLEIFVKTLEPFYDSKRTMSNVVDILVNQAIKHQSFCYSAARLCCFIEKDSAAFRDELRLTCQVELKRNPNKQGILLFIAELYMQLYNDGIYASMLTDTFKELLDKQGDSNIKCVCHALKLTGRSLDEFDSKIMDEVIAKLIKCRTVIGGTTLNLVDSVLNLRTAKWGYGGDHSDTASSTSEDGAHWDTEHKTVFFNADGQTLTREEMDFLAANFHSGDEYYDLSDPDELCDPEPEMDEEIQAAFKEFVKLSKR